MAGLEEDHAQVKVPPPLLAFLFVLIAFGLHWLYPLSATAKITRWVGITIVLAGLSLAFLAVRQLFAVGTTIEPQGSVTALVTDGPYRYSRNPIYLGYILILIGLPLSLGTYWGLLISPALVAALNVFVIRQEEDYLGAKFGSRYANFKLRVRHWL